MNGLPRELLDTEIDWCKFFSFVVVMGGKAEGGIDLIKRGSLWVATSNSEAKRAAIAGQWFSRRLSDIYFSAYLLHYFQSPHCLNTGQQRESSLRNFPHSWQTVVRRPDAHARNSNQGSRQVLLSIFLRAGKPISRLVGSTISIYVFWRIQWKDEVKWAQSWLLACGPG